MKPSELTDKQLLELYNFNSGEELEEVSINRTYYGTVEIHHVGSSDDMVLTISDRGAIYLLCLDNNEIYHEVGGALSWLKENKVEPFA